MKHLIFEVPGALWRSGDSWSSSYTISAFAASAASSRQALAGARSSVELPRQPIPSRPITVARKYYGEPMAGFFQYPLPKHSHHHVLGQGLAKVDAMRKHVGAVSPAGLVAVVSDSFDIFEACGHIWGELLRGQGACPRRLSGDPTPIRAIRRRCWASGHPNVLEILADKFGLLCQRQRLQGARQARPGHPGRPRRFSRCSIAFLYAVQKSRLSRPTNISFGSGGGPAANGSNRDTLAFLLSNAPRL